MLDKGFLTAEDKYWISRGLEDKKCSIEVDDLDIEIRNWDIRTSKVEKAYLKIEEECFRSDGFGLIKLKEWKEYEGFTCHAAFYSEEPVGYIITYKENEESGMIEYLFVHPNWRNKGIAKKLLDEAICNFKKKGLSQAILLVTTNNSSAIALYKVMGFSIDKEEKRFDIELL